MRAFGATDSDERLASAQAELETAGAGGRKKMRMTSTKTNIRDAEWEGTEWHGFKDDVVFDTKMGFAGEENEDKTARKRRKVGSEDMIITPRKPLRQMAWDTEAGEKVEDVLDDEVTIARRQRKAMRKSGSRMSLLSSEVTTVADSLPQSGTTPTDPFMDNTPTEPRSALSVYASTSNLSPNKRKLMRAKFAQQSTASPREPRRLSGALFADAASPNTPPNINFGTSTASPIQFGASRRLQNSTPLGTPVRGASALRTSAVPGTAPAKLHSKQSRTEIEQEMASFFTPIPRLKKVKRRSSPIKSYLQQLLENKEEVVKPTQDAQDQRAPTPERDSKLSFARDVPGSPASPQMSEKASSPVAALKSPVVAKHGVTAQEITPVVQEDESMLDQEHSIAEDEPTVDAHEFSASEDKVEVHAKLDAVATAVRLDFESVPDLSISRLGSFADDQSEPSYLDDDTEEDVSLIRDEHEEAIISESEEEEDFDPEEQLRLELAASQETASEESDSEEVEANVETADDEDADELMLDAPEQSVAAVANSTPAFESSMKIIAEPITHTAVSEESAIASDSSDSSTSASNANTSFEDEETAMLLAFVTKNQAKKLSRSASIASPKPSSPLRAALRDVTGNSSPPLTKKTAKGSKSDKDNAPASPTKKSRRLNPDTAIGTTDILAASEVAESSSVRRSGRTASKPTASKIPAPPSFIPVRHLGADGTEVKAPKKEKTIEQITKLNTGKNKAGCLQPMVVLKRLKMEEKMGGRKESPKKKMEVGSPKKAGANGAKEKKKLVWAEELTAVREFDEKSIVRPVQKEVVDKKKEKAEGKKLEETKKTRVRVGTASERANKAALGMVANGTPAKRKSREVATEKEDKKKETPAKRVRQPKLRSPKVRVAKEKKDEDVVMG